VDFPSCGSEANERGVRDSTRAIDQSVHGTVRRRQVIERDRRRGRLGQVALLKDEAGRAVAGRRMLVDAKDGPSTFEEMPRQMSPDLA
jgi:uncharacterized protein with von Willebrand factor type A (vWA) domain